MKEISIVKFRTKKADHKKVLKISQEYFDYKQGQKEIIDYAKARYYFMEDPNNPDEEIWMFIDWLEEYDNYNDSQRIAQMNNPVAQKLFAEFMGLLVPDSLSRSERWTEAVELRIDF